MKPLIRAMRKITQGNRNKGSKWAIAQKNWALQLGLRFQSMKWEDISTKQPEPMFDVSKLGTIALTQVAWWDEMHKKCHIAPIVSKRKDIPFPRAADGKIDPEKGEYADKKVNFDPKYAKEARMLSG